MDLFDKVGKKGQPAPHRIPDVESTLCPRVKVKTNHRLINVDGATICEFCKTSWTDLDAELRAARKSVEKNP